MSLLQQLLDNNELYCYYDFRSGTYLDYTGNTTLTGTADTSLVKGKLIIPSTKRLTIGSLAIGTNDFSIVSKTRPQSYSKHILGATGFNLTVYSEFDLSTFFGGSTYYNSANQSKLDLLRWNQIGATYNRDGNVTYYENGLSFRTIDISGTSAVDKTDTYYLGYTNAGFIEYNYFLIAKKALTATEMAQLTAELENKKWTTKTSSRANAKNILVDGDMKALGVSAWTNASPTGGTLEKKPSDLTGGRCIRMTTISAVPYFYQMILESGKTYRLKGYFRGDGSLNAPRVSYTGEGGTTTLITGTTSNTWEYFDRVFTAGGVYLFFFTINANVGGYAEFDNLVLSEVGNDEVIYKTESGIRADRKNYTAGQPISNTGFEVISGTFKVEDDVINGEKVKVIEASTTTQNTLLKPIEKTGENKIQSAYGEWEFGIYKPTDTTKVSFGFIAEKPMTPAGGADPSNDYRVQLDSYANVNRIRLLTSGSLVAQTAINYIEAGNYYWFKVRRETGGQFTIWAKGGNLGNEYVLVEMEDGTNPIINANITIGGYWVFFVDTTGGKIILSSEKGTYGIIKK